MSNETPALFPLRLTERGEKLTPEQLRVITAHADFPRLLELQDAVHVAEAAEQKAEDEAREARTVYRKKRRDAAASDREAVYAQAKQQRIAAEAEKERLIDEIFLGRIVGVDTQALSEQAKYAALAYHTAFTGEVEARKAVNANAAIDTLTDEEEAVWFKSIGLEVDTAKRNVRKAVAEYRRVVLNSALRRFVHCNPHTERIESLQEEE